MTPFPVFRNYFIFNAISISNMYLTKYNISKAAFLENTSRQPSLYIIWFRDSPKQKYFFMWGTYLIPSQTSKMKLYVKAWSYNTKQE